MTKIINKNDNTVFPALINITTYSEIRKKGRIISENVIQHGSIWRLAMIFRLSPT